MEVRVKNYLVTADNLQFTLNKVTVIKDGENAGNERIHAIGYYPKLSQLIEKLHHLELSESDAKTLHEMEVVIRATRKLVDSAGWTKLDFK